MGSTNQSVPIPASTRRRFEESGIDLARGYPFLPVDFTYIQEAVAHGDKAYTYTDAGLKADLQKSELFSAAKAVNHLTSHIGTEIVGLQLKDLNNKQKDELALLIAERGVVFFRGQTLAPQEQEALGRYWGDLYVCIFSLTFNCPRNSSSNRASI